MISLRDAFASASTLSTSASSPMCGLYFNTEIAAADGSLVCHAPGELLAFVSSDCGHGSDRLYRARPVVTPTPEPTQYMFAKNGASVHDSTKQGNPGYSSPRSPNTNQISGMLDVPIVASSSHAPSEPLGGRQQTGFHCYFVNRRGENLALAVAIAVLIYIICTCDQPGDLDGEPPRAYCAGGTLRGSGCDGKAPPSPFARR